VKDLQDGLYAWIITDKGDIVIKLDYQKAPMTVCNFVALAEGKMNSAGGKPFYDGLLFHRVISKTNGDEQDFMIQGGDPNGNGTGGPGYQFPNEDDPTLNFSRPGILAMANAGRDTNGSQFFITIAPCTWLNGDYTIFGHVVAGQTVVDTIKKGDRMTTVRIIRNGAAANAFKADQTAFNALMAQVKEAKTAKLQQRREADLATIAAKWPDAQKTADGLQYVITKPGKGPKPQSGQTVSVNYKGMLLSGKAFDDSAMRGGPAKFQVGTGRLIRGMDETLLDMQIGEHRTVIIPPELGYGDQSVGNGLIPANSFLVFDLELLAAR
jgi:peptidylprolyl isomerase